MKVYRIATESTCYKPHQGMRRSSLESLYYELGYIMLENKYHGCKNSIRDRIDASDTGYYYFIFLEDAINFAIYQTKQANVLKIMEFDFPEDVVYSLIGAGNYYPNEHYTYGRRAEAYISDSKLIGTYEKSNNIDVNIKSGLFIDEFRRCGYVLDKYYSEHDYVLEFSAFTKEFKVSLELPDNELLTKYINTYYYQQISNRIYSAFLFGRRKLIKTPAITGKSSIFLFSLWDKNRGDDKVELPEIESFNIEILNESGFAVDYSESGMECRIDYTRLIEKEDYDSAKKLLSLYRR